MIEHASCSALDSVRGGALQAVHEGARAYPKPACASWAPSRTAQQGILPPRRDGALPVL